MRPRARDTAACDVGTYASDMDDVARECDYVTGRSPEHGGAGVAGEVARVGRGGPPGSEGAGPVEGDGELAVGGQPRGEDCQSRERAHASGARASGAAMGVTSVGYRAARCRRTPPGAELIDAAGPLPLGSGRERAGGDRRPPLPRRHRGPG